jgi:hypothetical protein
MKLNFNEKQVLIAGVKTLYSTVEAGSQDARYYADIFLRLSEQDDIDDTAIEFVDKFTDKVLERTSKLAQSSGVNTEEARLRASVVHDIYVGIKEKVNASKRTKSG